jgi:hypothetical protein
LKWWAHQDLNLGPTPKAFGAALTTELASPLFQQEDRKMRILFPFHFAFKLAGFFQRAQFERCKELQFFAQASRRMSVAVAMLFQSPFQLGGRTKVMPSRGSSEHINPRHIRLKVVGPVGLEPTTKRL